MKKKFLVLGVLLTFGLAGCEQKPAEDSVEASVSEELFRSSYKRQCVSTAVMQGVPRDDADPICECTVGKIANGKSKAEVDAMSAEETTATLNKCIDEFKNAS